MDKQKKREFDPELKKIYDALAGVSLGSLSSFISSNEDSISILSSQLTTCISNLTSDAWSDKVSQAIASSSEKITQLLKNCTEPAHSILGKVQSTTNDLISGLDNYNSTLNRLNAKVEEQNKEVDVLSGIDQYKTTTTTNENGDTVEKTEVTDAYTNQVNKINGINGEIKTKDEELKNWKDTCDGYISILKGLLSDIGSESSNAALQATIGVTRTWDDIKASDIDPKFGDDYKAEGTAVYDANGKLLSRTYTIYDKDGNVVRSGTIHYDNDGKPTLVNYVEHYDKPTPKEEIIEHALPGDEKGLTPYFDDEVEAEKTISDSKTVYEEDEDGDGVVEYEKESHEEKEFTDGAKTDMDYKEEGKATITETEGEVTVEDSPEVIDGEGTLTVPDGTEYGAKTHEEFGENGRDTKEISLTEKESGEKVLDATDNTLEVDEYSKENGVVSTTTASVVEEADSDYVTVASDKVWTDLDGETISTQGYSAKVNKNDPNLTEMEIHDRHPNHKVETRYEDGKLVEVETVDGDVVGYREVTDNKMTVTYEYTDSRGQKQTKTVTYNAGSRYGEEQLKTELRDAQSDAGYDYIDCGDDYITVAVTNGPQENWQIGAVTVTIAMDPNAELTIPEAAPTINSK